MSDLVSDLMSEINALKPGQSMNIPGTEYQAWFRPDFNEPSRELVDSFDNCWPATESNLALILNGGKL